MNIATVDELFDLFDKTLIRSNGWDSAAQRVDEDLKAAGFVVPPFYHEYILPIRKEKLVRISDALWLFAMPNEQIQQIEKQEGVVVNGSYDLWESLGELQKKAIAEIEKYAAVLKDKNHDLAAIATPNVVDKIHLVRGAAFGYPPASINLFVENKNRKEAEEYDKILKEKFGINIWPLRLTAAQGKELIRTLEEQAKNMPGRFPSSEKNGIQLKISFAREEVLKATAKNPPPETPSYDAFQQWLEEHGYNDY